MDYVELDDLKSWLGIPTGEEGDTTWDTILSLTITAASAAVDSACNTTFEEEVPSAVKLAVLIQASRWFNRKDSPYGISGSPEMQGEMRLLAALDADVAVLVANHRVWWGAAMASDS